MRMRCARFSQKSLAGEFAHPLGKKGYLTQECGQDGFVDQGE
jgi:hypothetical protein